VLSQVAILLPPGFPWAPPECHVAPAPGMAIRPQHSAVDTWGLCHLAGCDWTSGRDELLDVAKEVSTVPSARIAGGVAPAFASESVRGPKEGDLHTIAHHSPSFCGAVVCRCSGCSLLSHPCTPLHPQGHTGGTARAPLPPPHPALARLLSALEAVSLGQGALRAHRAAPVAPDPCKESPLGPGKGRE